MDLHNEIETMSNDHYVFRNDKQIHFLDNNMFRPKTDDKNAIEPENIYQQPKIFKVQVGKTLSPQRMALRDIQKSNDVQINQNGLKKRSVRFQMALTKISPILMPLYTKSKGQEESQMIEDIDCPGRVLLAGRTPHAKEDMDHISPPRIDESLRGYNFALDSFCDPKASPMLPIEEKENIENKFSCPFPHSNSIPEPVSIPVIPSEKNYDSVKGIEVKLLDEIQVLSTENSKETVKNVEPESLEHNNATLDDMLAIFWSPDSVDARESSVSKKLILSKCNESEGHIFVNAFFQGTDTAVSCLNDDSIQYVVDSPQQVISQQNRCDEKPKMKIRSTPYLKPDVNRNMISDDDDDDAIIFEPLVNIPEISKSIQEPVRSSSNNHIPKRYPLLRGRPISLICDDGVSLSKPGLSNRSNVRSKSSPPSINIVKTTKHPTVVQLDVPTSDIPPVRTSTHNQILEKAIRINQEQNCKIYEFNELIAKEPHGQTELSCSMCPLPTNHTTYTVNTSTIMTNQDQNWSDCTNQVNECLFTDESCTQGLDEILRDMSKMDDKNARNTMKSISAKKRKNNKKDVNNITSICSTLPLGVATPSYSTIRIPPLPYSIHLKRSDLNTPLIQKFGQAVRLLSDRNNINDSLDTEYHDNSSLSPVNPIRDTIQPNKSYNTNLGYLHDSFYGDSMIQIPQELDNTTCISSIRSSLDNWQCKPSIQIPQNVLCKKKISLTENEFNTVSKDKDGTQNVKNAQTKTLEDMLNYPTFKKKQNHVCDNESTFSNDNPNNQSGLFSFATTITVEVPTQFDENKLSSIVPRLAIYKPAKKQWKTEEPNMKEIEFSVESGKEAKTSLFFVNRRRNSIYMRSSTIFVRFEPFQFYKGDKQKESQSNNQEEITINPFIVDTDLVELQQGGELNITVSFHPPEGYCGIFSGVLKLKSSVKSFVILLRGTATEMNMMNSNQSQLLNIVPLPPPSSLSRIQTSKETTENQSVKNMSSESKQNYCINLETMNYGNILSEKIDQFIPVAESLVNENVLKLESKKDWVKNWITKQKRFIEVTDKKVSYPIPEKPVNTVAKIHPYEKVAKCDLKYSNAGRDLFFRRSVVSFGSVEIGKLSRMRIELCNATSSQMTITIGDPLLPFVLLHNEIVIRPRCYVRLPLRFVPIQGPKQFTSALIAQSLNGEYQTMVTLVGSSY